MKSAAQDWVTDGPKIEVNSWAHLDVTRSRFVKLLIEEGVLEKRMHFIHPPSYDRVLGLWFDKRPLVLVDEAMTHVKEFKSTPENFENCTEFFPNLSLKRLPIFFSLTRRFRNSRFFPREPSLPYVISTRVLSLCGNDPTAILSKMRYTKYLVARALHQNAQIDEPRALEALRKTFERRADFSDTVKSQDAILTGDEWDNFLLLGQPTLEPSGSHSFGSAWSSRYIEFEAQNVHRNQWLIIMMELKLNPERFKAGKDIAPGEAYRMLGHLGEVEGQHPDWSRETIPGLSDDVGAFSNYWFRLFDYVPHSAQISNAANPLYFNELWVRETGLHTSW